MKVMSFNATLKLIALKTTQTKRVASKFSYKKYKEFNPFTPTRYPSWLKKIQLAFCSTYGGVKTISTSDIYQIKENASIKCNRRLLIQTICGSMLVQINSINAAILKLYYLRIRNRRVALSTLFSPLNW